MGKEMVGREQTAEEENPHNEEIQMSQVEEVTFPH